MGTVRFKENSAFANGGLKHLSVRLLFLFAWLLSAACSIDPDADCKQALAAGDPWFSTEAACGCERAVCEPGSKCFMGRRCCDPSLNQSDDKLCGCERECVDGEHCIQGSCCDARTASNGQNCGCQGACKSPNTCQVNSDGIYECTCKESLARNNLQHCGSCARACDARTQYCQETTCRCDITLAANLSDDNNCGCRGPCPAGTQCRSGICQCTNQLDVLCNGVCKPQATCLCDPTNPPLPALRDPNNCGCRGPCGLGEKCEGGQCDCDPIQHADNPNSCGCPSQVCRAGQRCAGGICVCDPAQHANDFRACGCDPTISCRSAPITGARDETCEKGQCLCPINTYLCDSDPRVIRTANANPEFGVCWDAAKPRLCADCSHYCANFNDFCASIFNADGKIVAFSCQSISSPMSAASQYRSVMAENDRATRTSQPLAAWPKSAVDRP